MSTLELADLTPLPAIVLRLLDTYTDTGEREVRLWGREGEDMRLLYPAELPDEPPAEGALELSEGPGLRLAVLDGDDLDDDATRFLAATLTRVLAYEREARSAARELSERYEEINLLYSVGEILGSVLSLEQAASRILGEVADLLGVRRASIWVYSPGDHMLYLAASVGADGLRGPIPVDDRHSVTAQVFRDRQPMNLERGTVVPRDIVLEPPPGRQAFLCVPINFTPPEGGARTVGVITLIGSEQHVRFSAGDMRMLSAIASQIGAALENQRLVQESLRRERFERELELAHDLQLKLLPDTSDFEGLIHVAARCLPADSVGGDFYHLFRLGGDRVGIMIGDVSSHGFPAALIMALTMSAVAISAQEAGPPSEVLRRVHAALIGELESTEMYLSLFYCVVDQQNERLTYANAGHPYAFCVRSDGAVERLGATSLPMGMVPLPDYGEGSVQFRKKEDLLFLFTDGLSDPFFKTRQGGEKRLVEEVVKLRAKPPRDILKRLFQIAEAAGLELPPDDRTAVLVRT